MFGALPLMLLVGFGARYAERGWLVIPVSLVIPLLPLALGAFDDGESATTIALWLAMWPAITATGYASGALAHKRATHATT